MAAMTYTYRLPWPPSVNGYWRHCARGTYLTAKAKEFRSEVVSSISDPPKLACRLFVGIELTPPDRRKRDLDNHVKGLLDALQHAGVFADDEQIDLLRVARCVPDGSGAADVTITALTQERP